MPKIKEEAKDSIDAINKGFYQFEDDEVIEITRKLNRNLEKGDISTRAAYAGSKVTYIEGWKAIQLANDIFGFNGWNSSIMDITVDFLDCIDGKWSVGISALVRISLKDGAFHEDLGYGHMENSKSKAQAFDKAKKEAITDGIKRALRYFGGALGNCLYDKQFLRELNRPMPKLNVNNNSAPPINTAPQFDIPKSHTVHEINPAYAGLGRSSNIINNATTAHTNTFKTSDSINANPSAASTNLKTINQPLNSTESNNLNANLNSKLTISLNNVSMTSTATTTSNTASNIVASINQQMTNSKTFSNNLEKEMNSLTQHFIDLDNSTDDLDESLLLQLKATENQNIKISNGPLIKLESVQKDIKASLNNQSVSVGSLVKPSFQFDKLRFHNDSNLASLSSSSNNTQLNSISENQSLSIRLPNRNKLATPIRSSPKKDYIQSSNFAHNESNKRFREN